jgi:hypothetical protein
LRGGGHPAVIAVEEDTRLSAEALTQGQPLPERLAPTTVVRALVNGALLEITLVLRAFWEAGMLSGAVKHARSCLGKSMYTQFGSPRRGYRLVQWA